jgi:phage-related minor tail protein
VANNTRIRGITIEINGNASKFNKELNSVNDDLKSTQNALRDVNKLLKFDPGNADLLSQKQRLLNQELTETKNKLEIEKKALAEISAQNTTGEQQAQQDALQREVIETENKVKSLEKQMKSFGSVGAQQIAALGEKFKEIGSKITDIGKSMTTHLTLPIAAAFTAAGKAASDYEENLNKIDVAFGTSAQAVKDWANNAMEQFGLSKVAATDAASSFGALAKGIGLGDSAAAEMSIRLAGLSADLGSYFNQANDVSAKALEGIFTGETEALKKFGVVMTQTNLEAFAASIGKTYSEMSEAEKVQLRYNFVLQQTTDAQGDYARTSDGTANSVKTFQAALEDLAVTFGQEVLPIITPIIQGLTNIVKAISALPEPVKKAIVVIGMVVAAVGPLLVVIGSVIGAIGNIMTVLPGLAGALGAGGVATAATGAAGGLAAAGTALAGILPTVALVVAALAAVGVAIYEVAKHWPEITQAAKDMVNKVKQSLRALDNTIKQTAVNLINQGKTAFEQLKTNALSAAQTIRTNIQNAMQTVASGVQSAMQTASSHVRSAASNIGNTVKNMWQSIKSGVSSAIQSINNAASKIRMPSITGSRMVSGIQWHADAMRDGMIMRSPTIFGANNGRLQGAGEAGAEVLVGYNSLRGMISDAVAGAASTPTINVYAQPGQDAKQIATEVQRQFVLWQRQRRVAMV